MMMPPFRFARVSALVLLLTVQASAADFPEPFNSEPDTTSQPMAPRQAAAAFQVPEGFRVEVFASEPEVRNPIAMTWDWRGRLWVAENYTYAERAKRFEMGLRDRVLILEDRDWDGRADQRTVFYDQAQVLTSVEVGRGGVWLMCPPQLLFIPDADGDDVPDGPPEVKLDGFTVAESNYHNFANGLRFGPDGWLYGRCGHSCPGRVGKPGAPDKERIPIEGGVWRYSVESGRFEGLCHGTTNPWGHDWDKHGELFFINTVNGHLWHMIPGAHFKESFGTDPHPLVYDRLDTIADHFHYDTTGKWSDSREGAADAFGGGHSHIGMMIYQADQWPEYYRDKLFTLNQHGRRANVEKLARRGSSYLGTHEPDMLVAGDPWFRGLEISTGPDGSAYVLDWSDTGECHEHTGVHRTSGRIYKVSHGEPVAPDFDDCRRVGLSDGAVSIPAMRRVLAHPNAWYWRQTLTRVWSARSEPSFVAVAARQAFNEEKDPVVRLRAFLVLRALGEAAGWEDILMAEDSEHLRVWGLRNVLDDAHPIDTVEGRRPAQLAPNLPDLKQARLPDEKMKILVGAAMNDPSALVRLTLASSLQRLPVDQRESLGMALLKHREDATDYALPSMVWWGVSPLVHSEPMAIVRLASACEWPDTVRWMSRALAERVEAMPEPLNALMELAARAPPEKRGWILQGVSEGLQGWRKAPKPAAWDAVVASAASDDAVAAVVRELSAVFGDGRALDEVKKLALDDQADVAMRVAALQTLIDARPDDLREVCTALLDTRVLNAVAVKGLALFDDPKLGVELAKRYRRFYPAERPAVMDVLVSRPAWAMALLKEIAAGRLSKSDLTPFHARQVRAFHNEDLDAKLSEVWGDVRESSEDKRQLIEKLKGDLKPDVLAKANLSRGRLLFQAVCMSCHVLYGEGGKVGPDLTGSGRASLDYLLENIIDPSAVVGADYQMTVLTLKDGRVISGVVAAQNERTLTLRLLTEETTVEKREIAKQETAPVSMMPEGLLPALQPDQVRDLLAYLMHPSQALLPE